MARSRCSKARHLKAKHRKKKRSLRKRGVLVAERKIGETWEGKPKTMLSKAAARKARKARKSAPPKELLPRGWRW